MAFLSQKTTTTTMKTQAQVSLGLCRFHWHYHSHQQHRHRHCCSAKAWLQQLLAERIKTNTSCHGGGEDVVDTAAAYLLLNLRFLLSCDFPSKIAISSHRRMQILKVAPNEGTRSLPTCTEQTDKRSLTEELQKEAKSQPRALVQKPADLKPNKVKKNRSGKFTLSRL